MLCDRNEDDDGECQRQRGLAADKGAPEKRTHSTKERSFTELRFASFRARL